MSGSTGRVSAVSILLRLVPEAKFTGCSRSRWSHSSPCPMHEQLHFAEVLAVLAQKSLPVGRGCKRKRGISAERTSVFFMLTFSARNKLLIVFLAHARFACEREGGAAGIFLRTYCWRCSMSTSCTVISDPAVIAAAIPAASPRFTQVGSRRTGFPLFLKQRHPSTY